MAELTIVLCYLCGQAIEGDAANDHVPPQQFYAPSVRRHFNLDKLQTIPTHPACTDAYGKDEEYFVWSLAPAAGNSVAAKALLHDNREKVRAGSRVGLHRKILGEFDHRPGGLFLPGDLVVKRFDSSRIGRVAWKVTRGLYHLETGAILPETTKFTMEIAEHAREPSSDLADFWLAVRRQPERGAYPGVFAYKYKKAEADDDPTLSPIHVWALLLWDSMIVFIAHLDPNGRHSSPAT